MTDEHTTEIATVRIVREPIGATGIVRRLAWAFALLAMAFFTLDGFVTFGMATSAPQQAAAAGNSCFRLIAVYVLTRAFDAIMR